MPHDESLDRCVSKIASVRIGIRASDFALASRASSPLSHSTRREGDVPHLQLTESRPFRGNPVDQFLS